MIVDPTAVCELLVGLPDVNVLGIVDVDGMSLVVHVESRGSRPGCERCGMPARVKQRPTLLFVDLPSFGRPCMLAWRKTRWVCPQPDCEMGSWTGEDERIAAPRMLMTARAGRWATRQVGKHGRAVSDVASELGCDWHTINTTVNAYGEVLIDDPNRIGTCQGF